MEHIYCDESFEAVPTIQDIHKALFWRNEINDLKKLEVYLADHRFTNEGPKTVMLGYLYVCQGNVEKGLKVMKSGKSKADSSRLPLDFRYESLVRDSTSDHTSFSVIEVEHMENVAKMEDDDILELLGNDDFMDRASALIKSGLYRFKTSILFLKIITEILERKKDDLPTIVKCRNVVVMIIQDLLEEDYSCCGSEFFSLLFTVLKRSCDVRSLAKISFSNLPPLKQESTSLALGCRSIMNKFSEIGISRHVYFDPFGTSFKKYFNLDLLELNRCLRKNGKRIHEVFTYEISGNCKKCSGGSYCFKNGEFMYKGERIFEVSQSTELHFDFVEIGDEFAIGLNLDFSTKFKFALFWEGRVVDAKNFEYVKNLGGGYIIYEGCPPRTSNNVQMYHDWDGFEENEIGHSEKHEKVRKVVRYCSRTSKHVMDNSSEFANENKVQRTNLDIIQTLLDEKSGTSHLLDDVELLPGNFLRVNGEIIFWEGVKISTNFFPELAHMIEGITYDEIRSEYFVWWGGEISESMMVLIGIIAQVMNDVQDDKNMLGDFSVCLKNLQKQIFSYDKLKERTFPFTNFSMIHQHYLIFLTHLNQLPTCEFSKIPHDVLVYKIFPHLIEWDVLLSVNDEIQRIVEYRCLENSTVKDMSEDNSVISKSFDVITSILSTTDTKEGLRIQEQGELLVTLLELRKNYKKNWGRIQSVMKFSSQEDGSLSIGEKLYSSLAEILFNNYSSGDSNNSKKLSSENILIRKEVLLIFSQFIQRDRFSNQGRIHEFMIHNFYERLEDYFWGSDHLSQQKQQNIFRDEYEILEALFAFLLAHSEKDEKLSCVIIDLLLKYIFSHIFPTNEKPQKKMKFFLFAQKIEKLLMTFKGFVAKFYLEKIRISESTSPSILYFGKGSMNRLKKIMKFYHLLFNHFKIGSQDSIILALIQSSVSDILGAYKTAIRNDEEGWPGPFLNIFLEVIGKDDAPFMFPKVTASVYMKSEDSNYYLNLVKWLPIEKLLECFPSIIKTFNSLMLETKEETNLNSFIFPCFVRLIPKIRELNNRIEQELTKQQQLSSPIFELQEDCLFQILSFFYTHHGAGELFPPLYSINPLEISSLLTQISGIVLGWIERDEKKTISITKENMVVDVKKRQKRKKDLAYRILDYVKYGQSLISLTNSFDVVKNMAVATLSIDAVLTTMKMKMNIFFVERNNSDKEEEEEEIAEDLRRIEDSIKFRKTMEKQIHEIEEDDVFKKKVEKGSKLLMILKLDDDLLSKTSRFYISQLEKFSMALQDLKQQQQYKKKTEEFDAPFRKSQHEHNKNSSNDSSPIPTKVLEEDCFEPLAFFHFRVYNHHPVSCLSDIQLHYDFGKVLLDLLSSLDSVVGSIFNFLNLHAKKIRFRDEDMIRYREKLIDGISFKLRTYNHLIVGSDSWFILICHIIRLFSFNQNFSTPVLLRAIVNYIHCRGPMESAIVVEVYFSMSLEAQKEVVVEVIQFVVSKMKTDNTEASSRAADLEEIFSSRLLWNPDEKEDDRIVIPNALFRDLLKCIFTYSKIISRSLVELLHTMITKCQPDLLREILTIKDVENLLLWTKCEEVFMMDHDKGGTTAFGTIKEITLDCLTRCFEVKPELFQVHLNGSLMFYKLTYSPVTQGKVGIRYWKKYRDFLFLIIEDYHKKEMLKDVLTIKSFVRSFAGKKKEENMDLSERILISSPEEEGYDIEKCVMEKLKCLGIQDPEKLIANTMKSENPFGSVDRDDDDDNVGFFEVEKDGINDRNNKSDDVAFFSHGYKNNNIFKVVGSDLGVSDFEFGKYSISDEDVFEFQGNDGGSEERRNGRTVEEEEEEDMGQKTIIEMDTMEVDRVDESRFFSDQSNIGSSYDVFNFVGTTGEQSDLFVNLEEEEEEKKKNGSGKVEEEEEDSEENEGEEEDDEDEDEGKKKDTNDIFFF